MKRVAAVIGNPKAQSRTLLVAEEVAGQVGAAIGAEAGALVVDLAEHAARLFDWSSTEVPELTEAVASRDVIIVASPTYKATYTGLLKAFFDWYGNNGLAGTVAIPVMVGAAPIHALAVEVHLRPLLVELGASVPTRGLYVLESQLEQLSGVVSTWLASSGPALVKAVQAEI
jgi:FMN reductase